MKNKIFYDYMTREQAIKEYQSLLQDDHYFAEQWVDNEEDFEEWCESHNIVLTNTKERAEELEEAQLE